MRTRGALGVAIVLGGACGAASYVADDSCLIQVHASAKSDSAAETLLDSDALLDSSLDSASGSSSESTARSKQRSREDQAPAYQGLANADVPWGQIGSENGASHENANNALGDAAKGEKALRNRANKLGAQMDKSSHDLGQWMGAQKARNDALLKRGKTLQAQNKGLLGKDAQLAGENAKLKDVLGKLKVDNTGLRSKGQRLKDYNNKLKRADDELAAQNAKLGDQNSKLKAANDQLTSKNHKDAKDHDWLQRAVAKLKAENTVLYNKIHAERAHKNVFMNSWKGMAGLFKNRLQAVEQAVQKPTDAIAGSPSASPDPALLDIGDLDDSEY